MQRSAILKEILNNNFSKSLEVLRNADQSPISFSNSDISWSNTVRYLGGFLDSKMNFKYHIETVIAKAKKAIGILHCFLKKFSHVKVNIKILMLYIRPIFIYVCRQQTLLAANLAKKNVEPKFKNQVQRISSPMFMLSNVNKKYL